MKGFFVGLSKLILGVAIALVLLSMAGVATARYFMARLSVLPPKPLYEGEQPVQVNTEASPPEDAPQPEAPPSEATPETAPDPEPATEPETPPEAYNAVVIQPIGLVMREGPGTSFPQVGGVDYDEAVVVLEESADQPWIRVRVVASGQEGWVKAGNTRPTDN
jgi:uncharacterized protein YgiM (DUF1202 family)